MSDASEDAVNELDERLTQAIASKISQSQIIYRMADFVLIYCPDVHVFELLFSPAALTQCESLIRRPLSLEGRTYYDHYDQNISKPFLTIVENDWKNLEAVVSSIKQVEYELHEDVVDEHDDVVDEHEDVVDEQEHVMDEQEDIQPTIHVPEHHDSPVG